MLCNARLIVKFWADPAHVLARDKFSELFVTSLKFLRDRIKLPSHLRALGDTRERQNEHRHMNSNSIPITSTFHIDVVDPIHSRVNKSIRDDLMGNIIFSALKHNTLTHDIGRHGSESTRRKLHYLVRRYRHLVSCCVCKLAHIISFFSYVRSHRSLGAIPISNKRQTCLFSFMFVCTLAVRESMSRLMPPVFTLLAFQQTNRQQTTLCADLSCVRLSMRVRSNKRDEIKRERLSLFDPFFFSVLKKRSFREKYNIEISSQVSSLAANSM